MKLEFYSENKLKKEILEIVSKHLNISRYKIFFFGSRVNGDNFPRADIDIGIEGPEKLPIKAKLKIEEDLDNIPTLYKLELVDFNTVSEKFQKEALKYIEYVK